MKVYKFGGASIQHIEGIKNVGNIINTIKNEPTIIVVSAMGKTTNALEAVVNAFYHHKKEEALLLFEQVKQQHINIVKYLLVTQANNTNEQLKDFFTEVEWLLHDNPVRNYDYYYDQIVCIGELLSSTILHAYLNEINIQTNWIDSRDYIRTDNNFRDANIEMHFTIDKIKALKNKLAETNILVTQGFIGCTQENESTTLGREGSDYSAAIIANIIQADSLTIWKDVKGVLNADPKQFEDAKLLPELSYEEIIEMAFYGAQVIHPKTIKPLQNSNIPLYVKCFLDSSLPGTLISNKICKNLPPIIVLKKDQVLVQLKTKDFSFVGEKPMSQLYEILATNNLKPTLTQMGAISISICLDDHNEKIEQLAITASEIFDVTLQRNLQLLTIRHYNKEIMEKLTDGKEFIMQQKTLTTYQALMV
jgi:aspartate kinase